MTKEFTEEENQVYGDLLMRLKDDIRNDIINVEDPEHDIVPVGIIAVELYNKSNKEIKELYEHNEKFNEIMHVVDRARLHMRTIYQLKTTLELVDEYFPTKKGVEKAQAGLALIGFLELPTRSIKKLFTQTNTPRTRNSISGKIIEAGMELKRFMAEYDAQHEY